VAKIDETEIASQLARIALAVDSLEAAVDGLSMYIELSEEIEWLKYRSIDGWRMLAVSDAYAELFLDGDAKKYRGQLDGVIWSKEIAAAFKENDDEAALTPGEWLEAEEPVGGGRIFVARKMVYEADGRVYCRGKGMLL